MITGDFLRTFGRDGCGDDRWRWKLAEATARLDFSSLGQISLICTVILVNSFDLRRGLGQGCRRASVEAVAYIKTKRQMQAEGRRISGVGGGAEYLFVACVTSLTDHQTAPAASSVNPLPQAIRIYTSTILSNKYLDVCSIFALVLFHSASHSFKFRQ